MKKLLITIMFFVSATQLKAFVDPSLQIFLQPLNEGSCNLAHSHTWMENNLSRVPKYFVKESFIALNAAGNFGWVIFKKGSVSEAFAVASCTHHFLKIGFEYLDNKDNSAAQAHLVEENEEYYLECQRLANNLREAFAQRDKK